MSFYTSLTGLNAATTELAVTSNNIANSATAGFKRSTASFGDIFATSPLQRAAAVVGQGCLEGSGAGIQSGICSVLRELTGSRDHG